MAKRKKRVTAVKKRKRPTRKVNRKVRRVKKRVGVAVKKRKRPKKRKPAQGRHLVKQVERSSVERVMAGKRRRRRKRKVVMAGRRRRGRSVGKIGSTGLLIGLGVGALALYLLTKKTTPTNGSGTYTLPPLTQTNNLTRNNQSSDLINYAIAGGLAIDAIIKLIDRLNTSSDQEVTDIYDRVNTTGDFSTLV